MFITIYYVSDYRGYTPLLPYLWPPGLFVPYSPTPQEPEDLSPDRAGSDTGATPEKARIGNDYFQNSHLSYLHNIILYNLHVFKIS